jgi:hypothetical protein
MTENGQSELTMVNLKINLIDTNIFLALMEGKIFESENC